MMKKIVINSNIIWTIANFRIELIKALQEEGYEIICVSSSDQFSNHSEATLKALGCRLIQVDLDRKGLNPLRDMTYMTKLYRIYRQLSAGLILHYTVKPNIYGTIAAKFAGIPSINIVSGLGSGMLGGGMLAKLLIWLYRQSFRFSSAVLFENEDDRRFFISQGIIEESRSYYVPGAGLDTEQFDGCEKKSREGSLTFLMVARLLKDKGIYEYIEACREIKRLYPYAECLLGGVLDQDNPSAVTKEELEKWIEEEVVRYLGQTDDIKSFFSQADVIVLPSYREGLSRVLLEAASCRKPIIATDVPGCKDVVINGKSGYLCQPKDAQSLFEAMVKMIKSSSSLEIMGDEARCHIQKNFSKEIVNSVYLNVIKKVLS